MKRKMSLLSNCWSLNFQQQWPGPLVFALFFFFFFLSPRRNRKGASEVPIFGEERRDFLI